MLGENLAELFASLIVNIAGLMFQIFVKDVETGRFQVQSTKKPT